jgi:hypothetical protein
VTSEDKDIELQRSLLGASVDPTDARNSITGFRDRPGVSPTDNSPQPLRLEGAQHKVPADPELTAGEAFWPECSPTAVLASLCCSRRP